MLNVLYSALLSLEFQDPQKQTLELGGMSWHLVAGGWRLMTGGRRLMKDRWWLMTDER